MRHIESTASPTVTCAERREWGLEVNLLSKCKLYWPRAPLSVDPLVTLQKHGDLSKAWRPLVCKITATLRLPCGFRGAQVSKPRKSAACYWRFCINLKPAQVCAGNRYRDRGCKLQHAQEVVMRATTPRQPCRDSKSPPYSATHASKAVGHTSPALRRASLRRLRGIVTGAPSSQLEAWLADKCLIRSTARG